MRLTHKLINTSFNQSFGNTFFSTHQTILCNFFMHTLSVHMDSALSLPVSSLKYANETFASTL